MTRLAEKHHQPLTRAASTSTAAQMCVHRRESCFDSMIPRNLIDSLQLQFECKVGPGLHADMMVDRYDASKRANDREPEGDLHFAVGSQRGTLSTLHAWPPAR
ncbi:hypothetical protein GCM10009662_65170 [Catellatospora coxensis]|uniref:Uncharacterized protein n=1 Tax=Catellatospora coxensis TaxID=310354 RepID=A0A8J3PB61_9ACTN|nr:hypothetical protein Cco03nite_52610 [Catellatospora coxensis]